MLWPQLALRDAFRPQFYMSWLRYTWLFFGGRGRWKRVQFLLHWFQPV